MIFILLAKHVRRQIKNQQQGKLHYWYITYIYMHYENKKAFTLRFGHVCLYVCVTSIYNYDSMLVGIIEGHSHTHYKFCRQNSITVYECVWVCECVRVYTNVYYSSCRADLRFASLETDDGIIGLKPHHYCSWMHSNSLR